MLLPPIAIVAVVWVVRSLDLRAVWHVARQADALWLAGSFVPLFLRFSVWGVKARLMLERDSNASVPYVTEAVLVGAFINLITPTAKIAGGVYRAAMVRTVTGWRFARAHGWILADQLTNALGILALFGLLAIGSSFVIEDDVTAAALRVSGFVSVGATTGFVVYRKRVWSWLQRPAIRARLSKWGPLWSSRAPDDPDRRLWLEAWLAPTFERSGGSGAVLVDLGLSALSWSFLCLSNAMVFRAIGVEVSISVLSLVLVLATFAGSFVGMGGIGVTEATLVALYTSIGIAETDAAAATLVHRASFYAVVLAWGGIAFGRSRARARRPRSASGGSANTGE